MRAGRPSDSLVRVGRLAKSQDSYTFGDSGSMSLNVASQCSPGVNAAYVINAHSRSPRLFYFLLGGVVDSQDTFLRVGSPTKA